LRINCTSGNCEECSAAGQSSCGELNANQPWQEKPDRGGGKKGNQIITVPLTTPEDVPAGEVTSWEKNGGCHRPPGSKDKNEKSTGVSGGGTKVDGPPLGPDWLPADPVNLQHGCVQGEGERRA